MPNKLGRNTTQRMALLKGQVTDLLWYGKIETTVERAKNVSAYADKVLTLAINSYTDKIKYDKVVVDKKGRETTIDAYNDGVIKLNARRKIMAKVYGVKEPRLENEPDDKYLARTKGIKHPLVEKIFNELAPKYDTRAKELNQRGGYTRVVKIGARRGDAAEMAIVELV